MKLFYLRVNISWVLSMNCCVVLLKADADSSDMKPETSAEKHQTEVYHCCCTVLKCEAALAHGSSTTYVLLVLMFFPQFMSFLTHTVLCISAVFAVQRCLSVHLSVALLYLSKWLSLSSKWDGITHNRGLKPKSGGLHVAVAIWLHIYLLKQTYFTVVLAEYFTGGFVLC